MSTTKNASKTNCTSFTLRSRNSRGRDPGIHAKALRSVKTIIREEKACGNWSLMRCAKGNVKYPRLRSSARTGASSMLSSSSSSIRELKKQEEEPRRWIGLQSRRLRKMTVQVLRKCIRSWSASSLQYPSPMRQSLPRPVRRDLTARRLLPPRLIVRNLTTRRPLPPWPVRRSLTTRMTRPRNADLTRTNIESGSPTARE